MIHCDVIRCMSTITCFVIVLYHVGEKKCIYVYVYVCGSTTNIPLRRGVIPFKSDFLICYISLYSSRVRG